MKSIYNNRSQGSAPLNMPNNRTQGQALRKISDANNVSVSNTFIRSYGISNADSGKNIIAYENGYLVLASTNNDGSGCWVMNYDSDSNYQWSTVLPCVQGLPGFDQGMGISIYNDHIVVAGITNEYGLDKVFYMAELTNEGQLLSSKFLIANYEWVLNSLVVTENNDLLITGYTKYFGNHNTEQIFWGIFSPDFSTISIKNFGDGKGELIEKTSDSGTVFCGQAVYTDGIATYNDALVAKFSATNQLEWAQEIWGNLSIYPLSIIELDNTSYALTGYTVDDTSSISNMMLMILNSNGEATSFNTYSIWDKSVYGTDLIETNDGNILLVGYSIVPQADISRLSDRNQDPVMAKFSPEGQPLWVKTLLQTDSENYIAELSAVDEINGYYVMTGTTSYHGPDNNVLLMSINEDGTTNPCNILNTPFLVVDLALNSSNKTWVTESRNISALNKTVSVINMQDFQLTQSFPWISEVDICDFSTWSMVGLVGGIPLGVGVVIGIIFFFSRWVQKKASKKRNSKDNRGASEQTQPLVSNRASLLRAISSKSLSQYSISTKDYKNTLNISVWMEGGDFPNISNKQSFQIKCGEKRWHVKVSATVNQYQNELKLPKSQVRQGVELNAINEKIAGDMYNQLANTTYISAEQRVAKIPLSSKSHMYREINKNREVPIKEILGLCSQELEGYISEKQCRVCHGDEILSLVDYVQKHKKIPEKIVVSKTEYPVIGIIEILAAARIIGDTDPWGPDLSNIGFVVEKTTAGQTRLKAVNIDTGCGFNYHETTLNSNLNTISKPKDLRYANQSECFIKWESLNLVQQMTFYKFLDSAIQKCQNNDALLIELFARPDAVDLDHSLDNLVITSVFNQFPSKKGTPRLDPNWVRHKIQLFKKNLEYQKLIYLTTDDYGATDEAEDSDYGDGGGGGGAK